jgi:hypothetical protein
MWAKPDDPDVVERMRTAHREAVTALGVLPDQDLSCSLRQVPAAPVRR